MKYTHVLISANGMDLSAPWAPVTALGVRYELERPGVLKATLTAYDEDLEMIQQTVRNSLFPLASRMLYARLEPLELYVDGAVGEDGKTYNNYGVSRSYNPNMSYGFKKRLHPENDLLSARDIVIKAEFACEDQARLNRLLKDMPLLYAIECLLQAVVYTAHSMFHAYKAVEAIENTLGGERKLTNIGIDLHRVKRFKKLANVGENDERHAPRDPTNRTSLPEAERMNCLKIVRDIVSAYAQHL